MIVTQQQIAEALGISQQMVGKYLNQNKIKRKKNGKIDASDPHNLEFFESKGVNIGVLGVVNSTKLIQKPVQTVSEPRKKEQTPFKSETTGGDHFSIVRKLDLQLKIANIKAKESERELKALKIEELRAKLIPKDLVEIYIGDTIGTFSQAMIHIPFSIVDQIISITETDPPDKREQIVKLQQEKYLKELKKAAETGRKKFIRHLQTQIKEAEQVEKEQGTLSRD